METYPPTYGSIAIQKNQINLCFDDAFPFFVFLRTPSHYDYSFEVNKTANISSAIDFISSKINVSPENISLLNIKTKEKINNSLTFNDFQIGDIILVSHDGLVPDDDVPELPPEVGELPTQTTQNLPQAAEAQPSQENKTQAVDPFAEYPSHTQEEQESENSNINMNDLTISDIRRLLTPSQKDFINRLISTYNLDEATISQLFLMCDKNESATEEMVASMCSS